MGENLKVLMWRLSCLFIVILTTFIVCLFFRWNVRQDIILSEDDSRVTHHDIFIGVMCEYHIKNSPRKRLLRRS